MKTSKYIGGSKVVSFRLPVYALKQATKEINELLSKYENNTKVKEQGSKQMNKPITDNNINTSKQTFECGCKVAAGLFVRATGCRIERTKHV